MPHSPQTKVFSLRVSLRILLLSGRSQRRLPKPPEVLTLPWIEANVSAARDV